MITRARLTRLMPLSLLAHVVMDDGLMARLVHNDGSGPITFDVRFRSCMAFVILRTPVDEPEGVVVRRLKAIEDVMDNHSSYVPGCEMCWLRESTEKE